MTHDDDLADLPADERAQLAVLEMALAERLAGQQPPDLWPRLLAEPRADVAAPPRRGRWLVAALLLLALGTVATFAVTHEPAAAPAAAPAADWPDDTSSPGGPTTVEELRQRLEPVTQATLRARGSWCASRGAWLRWPRFPLDDLFRSAMQPAVDRDDLPPIVAALCAETLAPPDPTPVAWTHEIVLVAGNDVLAVLLQTGGASAPRVAWKSPHGPIELTTRHFPFAQLQEQLTATSRATIAGLGLVLGVGGFAAVPADARRLRLLDVPADTVGELARYRQLRQIDLTDSPGWHRTDVLRQLPSPLEELVVSPTLLRADAYPALGALTNLRELFLVGGNPLAVMFGDEPTAASPRLDDAALAALAGLTRLQELALAGGTFTDAGLQALAALPLQRLALIDCPQLRGRTLGSMRTVRNLFLRGDGLDGDVLAQAAALPALRDLVISARHTPVALGTLRQAPHLGKLLLDTATPRHELAALASCQQLRSLALRLRPPLRDDELVLLHGLTQLTSLKLVSDLVTPAGRASLKQALPRCTIGDELW